MRGKFECVRFLIVVLADGRRLERLERTVGALVDRLDSRLDELGGIPSNPPGQPRASQSVTASELDPAPVFLIRDAATDAGVHSPEQVIHPVSHSDVISSGLITLSTAYSLLELFHVHYGRWVRFPEDTSTEALLLRVKKSPLLLCSIFLIAVRHTTQELADRLAPRLFDEAKRLITASLLEVPQTIEFFQAALILSLWSTTIGQVPLSIDSWLLTGYALQQALASPHFSEVLRFGSVSATSQVRLDSWCLWNHLCVAHLQYCVGTRRQSLLNQSQIDRCLQFAKFDGINNYEARMGAEVGLYWIIYNECGGAQINLGHTKLTLQQWHHEWAKLFGMCHHEPRSQFLQMGFHFAHLLAHCQSLKSPKSVMHISILEEMIQLSKSIINLAIDTADERTRHLTDHIYHIITFSALTLCRIVRTYEPKLRASSYDVGSLDHLVYKLVNWLKSIGLPCHAAHILGDIVSAQFTKLRPDFRPPPLTTNGSPFEDNGVLFTAEDLSLPADISFLYPNFIGSELFNMDDGLESWPEWAQIQSDTDASV
ncbi:hypothetical protein EDB81DRAFT_905749 [Dactylonectria macrodidyma]|uniref:Transcription factor domain-containing protein n=1 Tax=Dactylonectria macrodidyma TaxID=307937 RepID=A0A9P9ISN6_9HYPO|nr:hypothetical protein EDB81DRAFT_905749 [Dactylonectria macrodidyma]